MGVQVLEPPVMKGVGLSVILFLSILLCNTGKAVALAKTVPSEVIALNTIFARWGLKAQSGWNISGEPCSGWATDNTDIDNNPTFNPGIKCDCSFNSNTTCHIVKLKVYALSVSGPIPDELQNFTYLANLNIAQNYLTGSVPAFFGKFPMQYLSFGINALSGPIPKELGNLSSLVSLGMGSNNFSGPIPEEFGNLTNLQQLYIDSSGASGELPSTLSKLKNMLNLWASDNNFTGKIPDYIGSWTNMQDLRFQGNSFQGPIPSSLSNLVKLNNLRIGDIINGSTSSLDFISNMTSLNTLILRNCKIAGALSLNFGQFKSLKKLDLSFNNITGQIPSSLFSSSSLTFLFLGNNSLTGSLPIQKSNSLLNIDLSYNQLSGSFPSWVNQSNLQLNLVANNFVLDSSNSSVLPSGLRCLQRDIPCGLNSPRYYSFGIRCGSNYSLKSSDGTTYQPDNANLGAASYYVKDSDQWGVSNVGIFADASNSSYIITNLHQFQNTLDSELFQSARMSPSSLRYYGLGLENGNYTVELQFAETAFPNTPPPNWQSVGRRVFDIYIQGDLKEKDFDIRKEAGGSSFVAVVKQYIAPVKNNFLEIHFFWAGKGTCCIPTQGYYGPAISAISLAPFDFTPTVSNEPPNTGSKSKTGLIVGLVVGFTSLGLLLVLVIFIWRQKKRKSDIDKDLLGIVDRPDVFSYAAVRSATEGFSSNNILGEGGYGVVYKGKLLDGRIVAVKQLAATSHQGKRQFVTEIAAISAVQHRNLVKLYGCCIEGNKPLLVYEYLENRSLDQAIFGKSGLFLDWEKRFEICLGIVRGLAYLHEESSVKIIHRDIKASNILLDGELNPKISDFGLAKLYDDKKSHISTRVAGTIGYLAPEYAMRGHLTEKTDVFAFGVVALETVSGRPNSDSSLEDHEQIYLLEWAWKLYENKRALELVDPQLTTFNEEEVMRVIGVSLLCTQASLHLRPPMSRVVSMLTGDAEIIEVTTKPSYLTDVTGSSFMTDDLMGSTVERSINSNVGIQSGLNTNVQVGSTMSTTLESSTQSIIYEGR